MSTIKVDTIQNTSGVEVYTAKAWVNFDGTGTVAIRADGNVSSITDNGIGDYSVNFSSSLTDANYSASIDSLLDVASSAAASNGSASSMLSYSIRPRIFSATGSAFMDATGVGVTIVR